MKLNTVRSIWLSRLSTRSNFTVKTITSWNSPTKSVVLYGTPYWVSCITNFFKPVHIKSEKTSQKQSYFYNLQWRKLYHQTFITVICHLNALCLFYISQKIQVPRYMAHIEHVIGDVTRSNSLYLSIALNFKNTSVLSSYQEVLCE